ncbi:MAG: hypothetical protein P8Z68_06780 [Kineosporiaceae bacterium]
MVEHLAGRYPGHPLRVGIDGVCGVGKSTFARDLGTPSTTPGPPPSTRPPALPTSTSCSPKPIWLWPSPLIKPVRARSTPPPIAEHRTKPPTVPAVVVWEAAERDAPARGGDTTAEVIWEEESA